MVGGLRGCRTGWRPTSAVQPWQPPAQVDGVLQYVPRLVPGRNSCGAGRVRAGSETATQATFRADDAKCKSYGAEPGTDDYVRCRLAIDVQKANAERAAVLPARGR